MCYVVCDTMYHGVDGTCHRVSVMEGRVQHHV